MPDQHDAISNIFYKVYKTMATTESLQRNELEKELERINNALTSNAGMIYFLLQPQKKVILHAQKVDIDAVTVSNWS